MSRSYAPTELKRRLRPALEELEALGFLEPLARTPSGTSRSSGGPGGSS